MPGSANYGGEYWLYFPFSFLIFLKKVTWRCHDATMPGSANYGGARWGNEDPARGDQWATGVASSESLWMAAGEEGGWESVDGRRRERWLSVCGLPQQEKEEESLWGAAGERGGESGTRDRPPERAAMGLPLTAADDGTTPDCRWGWDYTWLPLEYGTPARSLEYGTPARSLEYGKTTRSLEYRTPTRSFEYGKTTRIFKSGTDRQSDMCYGKILFPFSIRLQFENC